MRTWPGSPSASPAATSTPARASRAASSPPASRGCAAHRKLAWLSVTSKPRSRSAARQPRALARRSWRRALRSARCSCAAPPARRPARARRRRGRARARPAAPPSRGRRSRSRCAGRRGPRPWRSCGTRAGAGGSSSSASEELVGWASANSTSASSSSTADAVGQPRQQPRELGGRQQLAGGVVGAGERDHAHVAARARPPSSASTPAGDAHGAPVGAARHERIQRVGGPRREQPLAGLDQRARGGAQQLRGAVAEDQALGGRRRGARPARRAARSRCRCG